MSLAIVAFTLCLTVFSAAATELGVEGSHFTIDGKKTFLLGMSYYAGLGASDEFITKDLDDLKRDGFNWIRVWGDWAAFTNNISAVETNGAPREPYLSRLEKQVKACDERGMIVDITLAREDGPTGPPRLQSLESHQRAVETLLERLRKYRNWYLDLGNERNIRDKRFVSMEDLKKLRDTLKRLDPKRLVTASHSSDDDDVVREMGRYLKEVRVDFLALHRPRHPKSAEQTEKATREFLEEMKKIGVIVPIQYQEPFRRGYQDWQPEAEDFYKDLRGAVRGGAAGWCFHNGSQRKGRGNEPRRSFDLREKRLYNQLDEVERVVVRQLKDIVSHPEGRPPLQ